MKEIIQFDTDHSIQFYADQSTHFHIKEKKGKIYLLQGIIHLPQAI